MKRLRDWVSTRIYIFFKIYLLNHVVSWLPWMRFRLWYFRTVGGMTIGPDTALWMGCRFAGDKIHEIEIGRGCSIPRVFFAVGAKVKIGDYVVFGHYVDLYSAEHDPDDPAFTQRNAPITIGDRAFIASRVVILPGVTIGEGAVVAAGAVVTRDVPPYTIVGGSPARVIRERGTREFTYTHTLKNVPPFT
jgi:acetyltransferase-like isoleucine patch superfamily enzyme